jgi:hypothetical protein
VDQHLVSKLEKFLKISIQSCVLRTTGTYLYIVLKRNKGGEGNRGKGWEGRGRRGEI